jgi:hypothetical protein
MHQMKCDLQGTKMQYLQHANILLKHLQLLVMPTDVMEKIPRSWLKKYASLGARMKYDIPITRC